MKVDEQTLRLEPAPSRSGSPPRFPAHFPESIGNPKWIDRSAYNVFVLKGVRGSGKSTSLAVIHSALTILAADPSQSRRSSDLNRFGLDDDEVASFHEGVNPPGAATSWRLCMPLHIVDPARFDGEGDAIMEQVFAHIDDMLTEEAKRLDPEGSDWVDEWRELGRERVGTTRIDQRDYVVQLRKRLREDVARGWVFSQPFGQRALSEDSAGFREYVQARTRENRESAVRHRSWRNFINEFLNFYQSRTLGIFFDDCDLTPHRVRNLLDAIRSYLNYERIVVLMAADLDAVHDNHILAQLEGARGLSNVAGLLPEHGAAGSRQIGAIIDRITREATFHVGKILPPPNRFSLDEVSISDIEAMFRLGKDGWSSATWLNPTDRVLLTERHRDVLRLYPLRDLSYMAEAVESAEPSRRDDLTFEYLLKYSVVLGDDYEAIRSLAANPAGLSVRLDRRSERSFAAQFYLKTSSDDIPVAGASVLLDGNLDLDLSATFDMGLPPSGRTSTRDAGETAARQSAERAGLTAAHTATVVIDSRIARNHFSGRVTVRLVNVLRDPEVLVELGFSLERDILELLRRPENLLGETIDRSGVPWNCRLFVDFFDLISAVRLGDAGDARRPSASPFMPPSRGPGVSDFGLRRRTSHGMAPQRHIGNSSRGRATLVELLATSEAPLLDDLLPIIRPLLDEMRAAGEASEQQTGDEAELGSALLSSMWQGMQVLDRATSTVRNAVFLSCRKRSMVPRPPDPQVAAADEREENFVLALGELNEELRSIGEARTVRAFYEAVDLLIGVVQPIHWVRRLNPSLLKRAGSIDDLLSPFGRSFLATKDPNTQVAISRDIDSSLSERLGRNVKHQEVLSKIKQLISGSKRSEIYYRDIHPVAVQLASRYDYLNMPSSVMERAIDDALGL